MTLFMDNFALGDEMLDEGDRTLWFYIAYLGRTGKLSPVK